MMSETLQDLREFLGVNNIYNMGFLRVDNTNWSWFQREHGIRDFAFEEFVRLQQDIETGYMDGRVVLLCQRLRDLMGEAVIITSGYRNPEWNKKIGGAPNSYHLKGMAVDIKIPQSREKFSSLLMYSLILFERVFVYQFHIHCDIGSPRIFSLSKTQKD